MWLLLRDRFQSRDSSVKTSFWSEKFFRVTNTLSAVESQNTLFEVDFELTDKTRVCSAHFKADDICRTLTGKRKLKPGSVPSLFPWTQKSSSKRIGPQRRSLKKIASEPQEIKAAQELPCSQDEVPLASMDHDYTISPQPVDEQLAAAQEELKIVQEQLLHTRQKMFFLERFSNDSQNISFYTGFKDYATLKSVFLALQPTATTMIRWTQLQRHSSNIDKVKTNTFRDESLPMIDQFFMFLCRVHQGLLERDLAVRFNVSQSSVSRILITWANYLYVMLGSIKIWPSRALIDSNMPSNFKLWYPNTRVIIDCTEVKVQTPSSRVLNSEVYSSYKSHTTFKGLIGITPCGVVSFISTLYTGAISDKEITSRCGIVDLLEAGDEVMADKGFLIQDLLQKKQASLVIPPFLDKKAQFSKQEVSQTQDIARLRIHVERAIRRIKEYHIFDGVIPLTLASSINQIWTVCSILTNFRAPLF